MDRHKVTHLKREEDSTKDFLSACNLYAFTEGGLSSDLEFICGDGTVPAHQFMLAGHSEYLRTILNRFHDFEFSIGDWTTGQMFLLDRRRGTEVLHISLPDLKMRHVQMMLDLFYRGTISLSDSEEAAGLKDVWRLMLIDTVRLENLDVISEVTISGNKEGINSFDGEDLNNHEQLLTTIKTEIIEEVDMLVDFKSGLEVECEICKDCFNDEEDLLRHMEHSHNDNRTMYDKVKYKRAKTDEDDERHPKDKGKGKGKGKGKSTTIEPKPLRRDIVLPAPKIHGQEKENIEQKTNDKTPSPDQPTEEISLPASEEQIDESSNESITVDEIPLELEVKTPIKKDKKGGKKTKNKVTLEMVRKTDELMKEKRAFESVNDNEPSPKKTKFSESRSPSPHAEDDAQEDEVEDTRSWENIQCLVCEQEVPIFSDRPGQNRRKYQTHLLTHFFDTQYAEIPEGLRVYQCPYKDCSYASGSRNPYIQHTAFKHDEWYRRINKRVEQAMKDPDIGDELEELSAIKEVFLTDYRIIPDPKNGASKPLWVEGKTVGKEAEEEEREESLKQRKDESIIEEEKQKEEIKRVEKKFEELQNSEQKQVPEKENNKEEDEEIQEVVCRNKEIEKRGRRGRKGRKFKTKKG